MDNGSDPGEIRDTMMKVEIDANSGFCGGVIRAIKAAEDQLANYGGRLYSLGAIVHNEEELSRLESLGLVTVDVASLPGLERTEGEPLLVRAHGEPPAVYRTAASLGYRIIDCTCPVVLRLQKDIRSAYARLEGRGKVVIFGKEGHPEVLGLVGQVGGDVLVVQSPEHAVRLVESGALRTDADIELFSQTTMNPDGYRELRAYLEGMMKDGAELTVHDTICRQVASRHRELAEFARSHDVIVFVSGRESSNGKVLFDLCLGENSRTHHVLSADGLRADWFRPGDSVGVCGATSTPKWLLEKVAAAVENLH